jgi:protein-S-isoprenylcysteine O-methyltransferase Ste14
MTEGPAPDLRTVWLVGLATLLWCALHSVLIATTTQRWLARNLGRTFAYSRAVYVLFSSLSFAVLALWVHLPPAAPLWSWTGLWQIPRLLLLAVALAGMVLGARVFDGEHFLGAAQIRRARAGRPPASQRIERRGVLAHVRHPWYAASFPLLVAYADFTDRNLIFRLVLVLYLIVGTELEERKLLREFGADYARYRREVPRFWPRRTAAREPRARL